MAILIPGLNLEVISASAETATFRSYLEPMPNGSSVSDNDAQAEMTSEVLDEPDVNVKSNKKKNNWWLLYHYDHLAYGEIHWRVQNDILYNQQNSITGLELHIDYLRMIRFSVSTISQLNTNLSLAQMTTTGCLFRTVIME